MAELDLVDIQGFILNGYHMDAVHYFVLEVNDAAAARRFLAKISCGDPNVALQITDAHVWSKKPEYCFNIGITAEGLKALGVTDSSLDTFPKEFIQGAAARAAEVGDTGEQAPENWRGGLGTSKDHVILLLHTQRDSL